MCQLSSEKLAKASELHTGVPSTTRFDTVDTEVNFSQCQLFLISMVDGKDLEH